jgi:hypothetical protein
MRRWGARADREVGADLTARLGLPGAVRQAVLDSFERFDGHGVPAGRAGAEVAEASRFAAVGYAAVMFDAAGGGDAAARTVARWSGRVDSTLGPLAGSYSNEEVPQFFGKMADVYGGTLRAEIASTVADGDHLIVLTRESGTVRGEPVAWTGVHVWSFDEGLATRFVSYGSAEYQRFWASRESAATHSPVPAAV